jgi:protein transport protein SEC61 subunit gamma-like protein
MTLNEKLIRLKNFWHECVRVLKVTKKPTNTEFKAIVKVSALGIAVIGMVGFLVFLLKEMIF